jgi:lambda repressor-like predicted transcriptional regulator
MAASSAPQIVLADWEKITPVGIRHAVADVREMFYGRAYQIAFDTQGCCFDALHPVVAPDIEPAIFRRYFAVYAHELCGVLRQVFDALLGISLAHVRCHGKKPVEWVELQLMILIEERRSDAELWIKLVCDKPNFRPADWFTGKADKWADWRAPRWLGMQPNGYVPYESSTAWTRDDQLVAVRKLNYLCTYRFLWTLKAALRNAGREARVKLAQAGTGHSEIVGGRKWLIQAELDRLGWSINDWARHAEVDFNTAKNYMNGKTKPYPGTKKKLDDAIGLNEATGFTTTDLP